MIFPDTEFFYITEDEISINICLDLSNKCLSRSTWWKPSGLFPHKSAFRGMPKRKLKSGVSPRWASLHLYLFSFGNVIAINSPWGTSLWTFSSGGKEKKKGKKGGNEEKRIASALLWAGWYLMAYYLCYLDSSGWLVLWKARDSTVHQEVAAVAISIPWTIWHFQYTHLTTKEKRGCFLRTHNREKWSPSSQTPEYQKCFLNLQTLPPTLNGAAPKSWTVLQRQHHSSQTVPVPVTPSPAQRRRVRPVVTVAQARLSAPKMSAACSHLPFHGRKGRSPWAPQPASPTCTGLSWSPSSFYKPSIPQLRGAFYLIRVRTRYFLPTGAAPSRWGEPSRPFFGFLPGKGPSRGCDPILHKPPASSQPGLGEAVAWKPSCPVVPSPPFPAQPGRHARSLPIHSPQPQHGRSRVPPSGCGRPIVMAGDLRMRYVKLKIKILSYGGKGAPGSPFWWYLASKVAHSGRVTMSWLKAEGVRFPPAGGESRESKTSSPKSHLYVKIELCCFLHQSLQKWHVFEFLKVIAWLVFSVLSETVGTESVYFSKENYVAACPVLDLYFRTEHTDVNKLSLVSSYSKQQPKAYTRHTTAQVSRNWCMNWAQTKITWEKNLSWSKLRRQTCMFISLNT